jgi:lipoprotein-releasing system permease protein
LNFEFFIAKRIYLNTENGKKISKPLINIAQISIALGIVVMLISISVAVGFKNKIKEKTVSFSSQIQLVNFDSNKSFETVPITHNVNLVSKIEKIDGIKSIQLYATKAAVFKSNKIVSGIILKGIDNSFNKEIFNKNIIKGKIPEIKKNKTSNDILISESTALLLNLTLGDTIITYFVQNPIRLRKFKIVGIFKTDIPDVDKRYAIIDMQHIQKLNKWQKNQISGYEISINNFNDIDKLKGEIQNEIGYGVSENEEKIKVQTIQEIFPMLFDWINLFDANVWVILILITSVAGFNMVSGLLVIILENTQMIGILKSMGSKNKDVRRIFIYYSAMLITKGVIWGNIIGFSILLMQYYFGIFKLDPESYYIEVVPVYFPILYFIALNLATIIITLLMLIVPSAIISKITPSKVIKFN